MTPTAEASLNTGLLFISTFYGLNTVMFGREAPDFVLPNPYASERENQLARQVMSAAGDKTGCFFEDCSCVSYCLVMIEEKAVLIGPYRTRQLRSFEVPDHLAKPRSAQDRFLEFHKGLPPVTPEQIKLIVRTLFVSLFGAEVHSAEQEINLRTYTKGELPPISRLSESEQGYDSVRSTGTMFYYMEQVRSGNYEKALAAYHKMMHGRVNSFILICIVEGTSRLRTLTAVALHQARVPDSSAEALLDDYKLKIRMTTNLDDMRRHNEKMIEQSCALVRSCWSKSYSQSIGMAVDYIHRNLSRPLTVNEISEVVNLTPNCFSTKFHEEVGIPATAYINRQRMRTAARLLIYTNLGIKNICTHIGMMDGNYFSRCFKKEYGLTPSQFRRQGKIPE